MNPHRLTAVLTAALLAGLASGCSELTTTGVPYDGGAEVAAADEGHPLAGTAWTLDASTVDAKDLRGTTIDFAETELSGQAPVNRYFAGYVVEGDQIEIGDIGLSLMAGPEELMAAEQTYLDLLESVDTFDVGPDRLLLMSDGQEVLGYGAAEQPTAADGHGGTEIAEQTTAVAESLVGMTVEAAEDTATSADLGFRVVATDGRAASVTSDYRTDRVNVEVTDGVVVSATVG